MTDVAAADRLDAPLKAALQATMNRFIDNASTRQMMMAGFAILIDKAEN